MNKKPHFKTYVIAGQLAWLIMTPLLIFIGGGAWLVKRFNLNQWLMIVFIVLGLFVMASSVWSYLKQLLDAYYKKDKIKTNKSENPENLEIRDKRDYDY